MNDYLKQIKDNKPMEVWDQEDGDFYLLFVPVLWDVVMANAEAMADENERLKEKLSEARVSAYDHIKEAIIMKNYLINLKSAKESFEIATKANEKGVIDLCLMISEKIKHLASVGRDSYSVVIHSETQQSSIMQEFLNILIKKGYTIALSPKDDAFLLDISWDKR